MDNVTIRHGDGLAGWREHAPFDRILLTGAVSEVPDALIEQLARGGALVAPIEKAGGRQLIRRVEKSGETSDFAIEERLARLQQGAAAAL